MNSTWAHCLTAPPVPSIILPLQLSLFLLLSLLFLSLFLFLSMSCFVLPIPPNDYCFWCNSISNYCHVPVTVCGECGVIGATIAPPITRNIGDIASQCVPVWLHVITLMQFHVFLCACHHSSFSFSFSCGNHIAHSLLPDIDDIDCLSPETTMFQSDTPCPLCAASWINLSNALPVLSCIIYLFVPCR